VNAPVLLSWKLPQISDTVGTSRNRVTMLTNGSNAIAARPPRPLAVADEAPRVPVLEARTIALRLRGEGYELITIFQPAARAVWAAVILAMSVTRVTFL